VLAELVDTERNYTKVLRVIIEVFQASMASNKAISKHDLKKIFSNVDALLVAHEVRFGEMESSSRGLMFSLVPTCQSSGLFPGSPPSNIPYIYRIFCAIWRKRWPQRVVDSSLVASSVP
jgi:hypothetical protein